MRRPIALACAYAIGATLGCAPTSDVAPAAPPLAPEGPITGGGPAAAWVAVTVYDGWNRTVTPGATVVCHETGVEATTDSAGRAWLEVPTPPFSLTAWAPGFGLVTVVGAGSAHVGLPLPSLTPRVVGVRGTVTQIVDTTASQVLVPDGRGGIDPWLSNLGSDTYQLQMAAGRNFQVTALEIGSSGLRNIVISPVQWKLPPHKTVGTVDLQFPSPPPSFATCSGSLTTPLGFTPVQTTILGRARGDLQDVALGEGTVVGWGTTGPLGLTYSLDYAPTTIATLGPVDLVLEAMALGGAGEFTRVRLPHTVGTSPDRFPLSANLTFPALPLGTAPVGGAVGTGLTPTLSWAATLATGAGAYCVTLRDAAATWRWDLWVAGGTATTTLPSLPPSLAPAGPTTGSAVTWTVHAHHCPGLSWDVVSLHRLAWDGTGDARGWPTGFTP